MSEPKSIMINDVKYVQDGAQAREPDNCTGLKYAIIRSREQGVMAGYVKSRDGRVVELLRARQLWRWSSLFVLTDLAEHGPTDKWESKFSCESSESTEMLEACGVLYCTTAGRNGIREVKAQSFDG